MSLGKRYYRSEEDRVCYERGCRAMAPIGRDQWEWLYVCDCMRMYQADAFVMCPDHAAAGVTCPMCGASMQHP
jgi:hypothetical protein